jgi:hypothetical protein
MPHSLSSSGVQLRGGSSISLSKSYVWVDVDGVSCCPTVMNHPGSTFLCDVSVWIQMRLSGTGPS